MDVKILHGTSIGMDFLFCLERKLEQPTIDDFLDYRSSLSKNVHANWGPIKREIKAVDEIINYLTKQQHDSSSNNK